MKPEEESTYCGTYTPPKNILPPPPPVRCNALLAARRSNGPILPRPETVRMAEHILNHYAKDSRKDHICLARRLEKWAREFTVNPKVDGGGTL